MKTLVDGIMRFQDRIFSARRERFLELATEQTPRALFITCSDSGIVPDMLMQCEPGDLFVCHNAGNIVPPWGEGDKTGGVTATIEYAVVALGIRNIIVCGHSDCGAMSAILHPEMVEELPAVRSWTMHAECARQTVLDCYSELSHAEQVQALTQENVLTQLDHLRTYPSVASCLARGELKIYGWVYDIATGQVLTYDIRQERFVPLQSVDQDATPRPRVGKARPQVRREKDSGSSTTTSVIDATVIAPSDREHETLAARIKYFLTPVDGRYEDLKTGDWRLKLFRDFTAGLIVAMVAIPLAMGFAMASGLRPEQGIVGGAIAGLLGALFGGSKYQVYGPTAAFIPVIGGLMAKYDHSMLVLASMVAGGVLMLMGLARAGRLVAKVPHSIVVGFTIGIAVTIALSQIGEVLGLKVKMGYHFGDKVEALAGHWSTANLYAISIGLGTFVITKYLLKVSPYIPAPLIALGLASLVTSTVWADKGLKLVRDQYGAIPTDFWVFAAPASFPVTPDVLADLAYFVVAIIFVAAIESLLCSRMADRLADNQGQPFNPNKELWGQGIVNALVPLLNGFPHTGALARTATNIKLGAVSPLSGIFKCVLKLLLAAYLAVYLEKVPMACIGGILLYVATAMVKPAEVKQVLVHNRFHIALMAFTAILVIVKDFLTGVLAAIILYGVLYRFFDRSEAAEQH